MAKKQDEEVLVDETADAGSEPRVYELGFHIDPELPVEEVKKQYQAIRALTASKGEVVAEVEPEKIQLAYTISRQEVAGRRDFSSAYFAWIAYEMTPVDHTEVIAAVNANKAIVRFIDIVTTKDAARHAVEAHEFAAQTAKSESLEDEQDEDAMRTELDAALENVVA